MTLNEWAANLQREVYQEWLKKFKAWEPGFKVFYGPVRRRPKLMIISLQPGGGKEFFIKEDRGRFEKDDFSTHKENTYIKSNNRFARSIKGIFQDNISLLKQSVILPVIFWRAKTYSEWKKNPDFKEMENFSFLKVKMVIEKLKPQKILVLGNSAGKKLGKISHILPEKVIYRRYGGSKDHVVVATTKINNIPTLILMHPSGARLSKKDELKRNKEFRAWLSRNS